MRLTSAALLLLSCSVCVFVRGAGPLGYSGHKPRPHRIQRSQCLAQPSQARALPAGQRLGVCSLRSKSHSDRSPWRGNTDERPGDSKRREGPSPPGDAPDPKGQGADLSRNQGSWVCAGDLQTGDALAPSLRGEWPVLSDSQGSAGTQVSTGDTALCSASGRSPFLGS